MSEEKFTFLNRDLSWLSFNYRVLLEAADPTVPLYSRIQFLSIFSSNLDEFFRVRMPSIYAFTSIKSKKAHLREEYPESLVQVVKSTVQEHLEEFGRILTGQILPSLKEQAIHLYYRDPVRREHKEDIQDYFLSMVLSFLQPVILRPENRDVVFLENNRLYFIVDLESKEKPEERSFALLNIPSEELPRFYRLPAIGDMHYIVFLDDVIRENLHEIFPGFIISGAYSVKLTRDAELNLEDEFSGDLVEKIERKLEKRDIGPATRFLFDAAMPEEIRTNLKDYFSLNEDEMVEGGRYHNLKDLGALPDPTGGKLGYDLWPPVPHRGFQTGVSVFHTLSEKDRLLHLPYHSYNYILRFFNEAAIDPAVREIYVALYRVAGHSHIVNALISAARNGKKVVVFVELKARFDEANNLRWAKKMKTAGVEIIYSIPGLKVHSKIALVKRTEGETVQCYSLLATGNFNESTGRFYCDHVFFTARKEYSEELERLFIYLQSRKQPKEYGPVEFRHLLVSQFNMVNSFRKMIDREIRHAQDGEQAGIIIKVNNLQERSIIKKLYEASNAGVKIRLIVRSICCLAPGLEGQSSNIEITRIVDRYLEHARVFVFQNKGKREYFIGSADWMSRNLKSRIEVVFPIYGEQHKKELQTILDFQLSDNRKAVRLLPDLTNHQVEPKPGDVSIASQEAIYNYVKGLETG